MRVRLRVNGDTRSGVWIMVGSSTDYPNIHRLREAIGVTLLPDPSYGLNRTSTRRACAPLLLVVRVLSSRAASALTRPPV